MKAQVRTQLDESLPADFSVEEDFAVFAPRGSVTLNAGIEAVTRLIGYCRENAIRGLIVDVRAAAGLANPTVSQKYWYTQEWAKAAGRDVAVALVAPPAMIDPTKIGVTMAANAGLRSDVFDQLEDAIAWVRNVK